MFIQATPAAAPAPPLYAPEHITASPETPDCKEPVFLLKDRMYLYLTEYILTGGMFMEKSRLADQIYDKVAAQIPLEPLAEFDDLKTIITPDGREVGTFRAFAGDKIEKFSLAEFSLAPGMDYTNSSLKPTSRYNIPRFSFNYMETPDKIMFDVDLYPAVDLAPRQDYIDKYYEQLTDIYLQEKKAPYFSWELSDRSWVRVSASPYFFKSTADVSDKDKVYNLIHAYLDVALQICAGEQEVSDEEAQHMQHRINYIQKILLEREPERHMLEKAFGKELTERLGNAMV